ncbi:MAG: TIGR00341 family protein, partial [Muribaculaceae bacterium]|nr:TIGR00341 family protein [Muribaculaceae bacterium]
MSRLRGYFALTGFLLPQEESEKAIRDGVSFRGPNILILIFAIFIASLGLNTNSTAVIIGAMLISPLMGPIIGIGL